jgi:hypothetical protein
MKIAHYLLAAVVSEFMQPDDWKGWADRIISRMDTPPIWVIDIALANSTDKFKECMSDKLRDEELAEGNLISIGDAVIGFYYLRYNKGDLSFEEFLKKSGEEADSGSSDFDCEEIYSILNEYERILSMGSDTSHLINIAKELMMSSIEIANYQLNRIKEWCGNDPGDIH